MKKFALLSGLAFTAAAFAALEPIAPVNDANVTLVPDVQKKVMNLPTLEERMALTKDKENKKFQRSKFWRRAVPFVLTCRTTAGERGPWKVMIGKKSDLSDARILYVDTAKIDKVSGRETEAGVTQAVARIEVPRVNLEIATRYYWRVGCRNRCGFGCHPNHVCEQCKHYAETPISSFVTEDFAPRWIAVEGNVHNFRDLGGRIGLDGRRVRQGLAYRGQGLNDNSVTGEHRGRNRLTVDDVEYLTETLGIKTDLDLRGIGETADMERSPLGAGVKFIRRPSYGYVGIFTDDGKKVMAANFREFCDRANYPI